MVDSVLFSEDDARKIYEDYHQGDAVFRQHYITDMARKTYCSRGTIWNIVHARKCYSFLEEDK